jgi:VCBS repeat-containing protein
MSTTTPSSGGTITSFSNTPQARDDVFTLTEDTITIQYLDVMANDLGGKAKSLYSIDDGTNSLTDLVKIDVDASGIDAEAEKSHYGASIRIVDGKVAYDVSTFPDDIKAQTQGLTPGKTFTDSFTYAIRLGNRTLSWATATVVFTGANDRTVLSAIAEQKVTEAGDAAAQDIWLTGELSFSDKDIGDSLAASVVSSNVVAGAGVVLPADLAAALRPALTFGNAVTSNGGTQTIAWTYDPAAVDLDFLRAGQTITVTYNVKVGDSAEQPITITIMGTNDTPELTASLTSHTYVDTAADNTFTAVSGELSSTDRDAGDSKAYSIDGGVASTGAGFPASEGWVQKVGTYGTLYLNSTSGAYTYVPNDGAIEGLKADASENFSPVVTDGSDATDSETLTINITGANDTATIVVDANVTDDRMVTEAGGVSNGTAGDASASGKLLLTDVDVGEAVFQTPASLEGTYGTFTFDEATGAWSYALDNTRAATQALPQNQAVNDTLVVWSVDGTASHEIVVNITGANDAASIAGSKAGSVMEDGVQTTGGTLTVTDVDTGEAAFRAVVQADLVKTYGTFTFNETSGVWGFTLDNAAAQSLTAGQEVVQSLTVVSKDGTAMETITVTVIGMNEASFPDNDHDDQATSSEPLRMTSGGNGKDTVRGSAANDILMGGQAGDTIYGGAGDDIIYGYDSSSNTNAADGDLIYGGSGNDVIYGNQDNDTIWGGSGDDTIVGNLGADVMYGGSGADTFVFSRSTNSKANLEFDSTLDSIDTIMDFTSGTDRIDISGMTLNGAPSLQTTMVDTSGAATLQAAANLAATGNGSSGTLVKWFQYGGDTYVLVDNSASASFNSAGDGVLKIAGLITLSSNDLIL